LNRSRSRFASTALLLAALIAAAPAAEAQYFGKNKIQYRSFDWKIYHSPHFDVYYYPEEEHLLQKVVSFAESAYDRLSREFDFQIKEPTPLIFYATHSAFEQNNIILNFIPEGIGAFASPARNRMVLPVDLPDPELLELIAHELTHIFQYHILFEGRLGRSVTANPPQWFIEGMASYIAKDESARDRMFLRDAVVNDNIPSVTGTQGGGFFAYRFGHAVFDFIEERWGKEGFRDFLYEFRNSLGSRVDRALERAFRIQPEDFDLEFRRWLRRKYLPELVRTGEPSDFGKPFNAGPDEQRGQHISPAASPSGDLVASFSTARGDVDVVLFDTRKREAVRNLTRGFSSDYQYLVAQELALGRKMGRDLAFSPDGNTLALFAKRERGRSLVLVDVLNGKVERLVDMEVEQQQSPAWAADGRRIAFSANRGGQFDIFEYDLESGEVRNLTNDPVFDGSPVYSPDGKSLVLSAVVGGFAKIFRVELANLGPRTALTHGESNDVDAVFSPDGQRLYFTSDRSGSDNIYGLELASGEIKQYTNAVTGCFMPTVLPAIGDEPERLVYTGYWKQRFDLYLLDTTEPVQVPPSDEVAAASIEDAPVSADELPKFEPDISVTLDDANVDEYRGFKLFLEDAGAVVGVNNDQTFISDTYLRFSDYLGDRRLIARFSSIESFSNFDVQYWDLKKRWQWGVRLFDDRTFFIAQDQSTGQIFRVQSAYEQTGVSATLVYPFNFYRRLEFGGGYQLQKIGFQAFAEEQATGITVPVVLPREDDFPFIEAALVGDSTVFADFGPVSGRRWRLGATYAPDIDKDQLAIDFTEPGSTLTSAVTLDARQYIRVTRRSNLAMRLFAGASSGNAPQPFYFGGLDTLRGFDFRDFAGNRAGFLNVEYRFPLFDFLVGPALQIRGIRGRIFMDVGAAYFTYSPVDFKFWDSVNDQLQDGRAAYGWGFTVDLFGLPMNWDFAKQYKFATAKDGYETSFWIGYQF
jgi:hypothetical protein